jgi:peroxiredoxin
MKKIVGLASALLLAGAFVAFAPSFNTLEIGDEAPLTDVEMPATDGKNYSLEDIQKDNGLLVIFSCNTCPFVLAWEDQYPKLGKLAADNNVGMVLVNSNEAKRNGDDSMEAMKAHFAKAGYTTPYVVDANHKLADAFGARTTPHVFLFNEDLELVYRGSINDMYEDRDKKISKTYLEDAIKNMTAGEEITPSTTKEYGCTIKRS